MKIDDIEVLTCHCGDPPMIEEWLEDGSWVVYCYGCYMPNPEYKRHHYISREIALWNWNKYRVSQELKWIDNQARLDLK